MFELSKVFWAVAQPTVLLLLALALGMVCLWVGWRRLGIWLVSLPTLVLLAVTLFPLERLGGSLELRSPPGQGVTAVVRLPAQQPKGGWAEL